MFRAEHLAKSFSGKAVLKDISFSLNPGEILAVLGPSGCGKTVLIQILTGLLPYDSGEIYFNEQTLSSFTGVRYKEYLLQLGFMFQQGALFDFLTVGENLALPLNEHFKLKRSEVQSRISDILQQLDLGNIQNKMPYELSGGMLKRVSLGRAMIMRPKVLFCDEPCSGLDPLRKKMVYDFIRRMRDTYQSTVLVVTHDAELVPEFADRALVLYNGNIAAIEKNAAKPSKYFMDFSKGIWSYTEGEKGHATLSA